MRGLLIQLAFFGSALAVPFDFTLAGLYTIHSGFDCSLLQADHVVFSEAGNFAVDYANENILAHTNLRVRHMMADTCDDRSKTLQETVYLIRNATGFCNDNLTQRDFFGTIFAMIGSFDCDLAESINYLLQAFCIPVVSAACTATQLGTVTQHDDSQSEDFQFFLRTPSSDIYRAQIMYDVLLSQEWYHIAIISDTSTTGTSLTNQFTNLLYYCTLSGVENGVFRSPCVERKFDVDCTNANKFLSHLAELHDFFKYSNVRVFVIFGDDSCINKILLYIQGFGYKRGDFQFVLPSTALNNSLDIIEYAYAVDTHFDRVIEFEEKLANTTLRETRNPFLQEVIMVDNVCCWDLRIPQDKCPFSVPCTGNETLKILPALGVSQARAVIDSVLWVSSAIAMLHDELCEGKSGFCDALVSNFTGSLFFSKLLSTNFRSVGNSEEFRPLNGSGLPVYDIWQKQKGVWTLVLQRYNPLMGPLPSDDNQAPLDIITFDDIREESESCQKVCVKQVANFVGQGCCWTCQDCPEYNFVNSTTQMCDVCPSDSIPNKYYNECTRFEKDELFLKPTGEVNVIIVLNAIGILLTAPAVGFLYLRRNTPMVQAAAPDLAYQQAASICVLFMCSALMLPSTSSVVCGIVWSFSAMFLTATHTVSLAKALRIARPDFFNRLLDRAKTRMKASLMVNSLTMFIQLFIVVLWIFLRPPKIIWERKTLFPNCTSNNESQTIILLLNPVFILLMTLYFQKQACGNRYMFQVHQARIGLAGSLCFLVNYLVLLALILIEETTSQVRSIVLMCIPMVTGFIAYATSLLPITWEVLTKSKQNDKEYVTRQRSRQFQQGNMMYYVESVIFNRPKGQTINSITSAIESVVDK